MHRQNLIDAYQSARLIDDETDVEEAGEVCNAILRLLHHVDRQAYVELVAWDAGRVTLTEGVVVEDER